MTPRDNGVAPLALPTDDGSWADWLSERAEAHLVAAEHHTERLRSMDGAAAEAS